MLSLIAIIAVCFAIEIFWAGTPILSDVARGVVPHLSARNLYIAIGILGATVMPHNLYLHSALVQTRRIGKSEREKLTACRFNLIDSTIALNGALLVNAAILVLAAMVFFKRGIVVTEIQQASHLLTPLAGDHFGQCFLWSGSVIFRAILNADRHHGRPDRDGRLSQHPHAPLAAAVGDAHYGHHPGCVHGLSRG